MNSEKLSTLPPKGMQDWYPDEFKIRSYIFAKWREVCKKFGYEEYLTPILESADIYRAKSGEDIGGKELMVITDRAGRELAIRPEMTPSVTRMVSKVYESSPKPIRYFSIANFVRNEKPQRGRNREFWQLNLDIFGTDSLLADIEIIQVSLEIMLSMNAPKDSFVLRVNNRKLIDEVLGKLAEIKEENRPQVVRILDKYEKLSEEDFTKLLTEQGLNELQIDTLSKFIKSDNAEELIKNLPDLESTAGFKETVQVMFMLTKLGYGDWIEFKPNVIRGFDYYDGIVFEVFDKNPENNRAMFGGGRYNGLSELFVKNRFSAVGVAPGDETTKLFLESWGLTEEIIKQSEEDIYFIPVIDESLMLDYMKLAMELRSQAKQVEVGIELTTIGNALSYANKKGLRKVVIMGSNELDGGLYKVKDMVSGKEETIKL